VNAKIHATATSAGVRLALLGKHAKLEVVARLKENAVSFLLNIKGTFMTPAPGLEFSHFGYGVHWTVSTMVTGFIVVPLPIMVDIATLTRPLFILYVMKKEFAQLRVW